MTNSATNAMVKSITRLKKCLYMLKLIFYETKRLKDEER